MQCVSALHRQIIIIIGDPRKVEYVYCTYVEHYAKKLVENTFPDTFKDGSFPIFARNPKCDKLTRQRNVLVK